MPIYVHSLRYDTGLKRRGRKKDRNLQMKALGVLYGNLIAGHAQYILEVNLRVQPVAAGHPIIIYLIVHHKRWGMGRNKRNPR